MGGGVVGRVGRGRYAKHFFTDKTKYEVSGKIINHTKINWQNTLYDVHISISY